MKYISTRGGVDPVDFGEAVLMGLARDGGLLLPAQFPDVSAELAQWRSLSYVDLACRVFSRFTGFDEQTVRGLAERSYSTFRHPDITPVVKVGDVYVMELFHGPTLAFKDVALQFLGNLFEQLLAQTGAHLNILAATSGDTGSAAIYGVRGRERMQIVVLHPKGRVSPVQERQMTSVLDANVHNVAVEGTFDDCQSIVKTLFGDLSFKDRLALGAVNSINWARILAQVVYYFYGAFRAMDATGASTVQFSVPTGNFGDIFAGYVAVRMGLPISRLILATNENDILDRFFRTDVYELGSVHHSISPSMDIQVASNFERYLYYRVGEDPKALGALMQEFAASGRIEVSAARDAGPRDLIVSGKGCTADALGVIGRAYREENYLLDPHTAVGVHVALQFLSADAPTVCLATAHPAKFPDPVREATGMESVEQPILDALKDAETRCDVLPARAEAVRAYIEEHL